MDWQDVSFDWNQARAFLATVEEGSLSAAARALGLTQPTLGRQISGLEAHLGVLLFERVGRRWVVTPNGRALAVHVRKMQEAALQVSLTASSQVEAVDGLVRITASDIFATVLMPEFLVQLKQIAPNLQVEIIATNDIRDIQRREADIAIRHIRPDQPELLARLIKDTTAQFYAGLTYFDSHPTPQTIADLKQHDFISFGDPSRMIGYLDNIGIPLEHQNFRFHSESGVAAWEMAKAGLGILAMSDNVATRSTGIAVVLPDLPPITFPVWLTTHKELHTSRRIRLVFDALADFLSQNC